MTPDKARHIRLLSILRTYPALVAEAHTLLEPLCRYDTEHQGDLVRTLQVYFLCNSNASRAAQTLFLHRNGLLYRLWRIEELLGASLGDRATRLSLELALVLVAEGETMREDPDGPRPTHSQAAASSPTRHM